MAIKGQLIGVDELRRKFDALSESARGDVLDNAALAGGMVLLNAARKNIKDSGLIRTGNMSRSLHQEVVERTATSATVEAGTNVEYAAIHEYGGTIRPKSGKYLAIPIGTLTGSPTKHDLRLIKSGSGNLLLLDESGTAQYVLKTSVDMPARPYLRPALDDNRAEINEAIGSVMREQIEKAAA
jgi:HK97 gp10 family phage protein